MNILTMVFTLAGFICVFKGILCLRKAERIGLHVIFKKQTPVVDLRNYILILLGIILMLLGLHTIPHYILEKDTRDSLCVNEQIVGSFNKDFDVNKSSGFTIPIIRPHNNSVSTYKEGTVIGSKGVQQEVFLLKTYTSSGFIEFNIPRKFLLITNSNGTKLTATRVSETTWYVWPWWKLEKFRYELH